jgi:nicotinamidase-related amidase
LKKGTRVTSVVSLRTVPIVVLVDMRQEYQAKPRLPAISEVDRVLDNCRRVLDHPRRIGLPVAFIQVTYPSDTSASYVPDDMSADDVHCAVSKISGIYGDVYETTDWIASTLPRKFGHRKNAGG